MARKSINHGLPDLDRFLEGREGKFVTYAEGSDMYGIPYYSFVRLAKEVVSLTDPREERRLLGRTALIRCTPRGIEISTSMASRERRVGLACKIAK